MNTGLLVSVPQGHFLRNVSVFPSLDLLYFNTFLLMLFLINIKVSAVLSICKRIYAQDK